MLRIIVRIPGHVEGLVENGEQPDIVDYAVGEVETAVQSRSISAKVGHAVQPGI